MRFIPSLLSNAGSPYAYSVPTDPLTESHWVAWNQKLAQSLGLPETPGKDELAILSGSSSWPTHCTAYAGHQFGYWAGQLGDGRAHSLGLLDNGAPPFWEVQLKGAGRTPYSRRGDGRAVLRSSIREYLASEAMAGLGIPTTRALALTASATLEVWRERPEPAAIVTRLAPSFLRFGHFEHYFAQGNESALKQLVSWVTTHDYPELAGAPNPALALLEKVSQRTALLVADWQAVGFCHGVLNTDNMSILGLTLDYGPFGFMDRYDPHHACNHSDSQGRYAYDQQPQVGLWNCAALAQALSPLIDSGDAIERVLTRYTEWYEKAWQQRFSAKLGWSSVGLDDASLISKLLGLMHQTGQDFTRFFRALSATSPTTQAPIQILLASSSDFQAWWARYQQRLEQEGHTAEARSQRMQQINPKYVLRNHLAELAIQAAHHRDFSVIAQLKEVLDTPYGEHPEHEDWADEPPDWSRELSVSCSS